MPSSRAKKKEKSRRKKIVRGGRGGGTRVEGPREETADRRKRSYARSRRAGEGWTIIGDTYIIRTYVSLLSYEINPDMYHRPYHQVDIFISREKYLPVDVI